MRCLAARVNYKTLIIICALFTLITVLLWNRCSSDTSLRFQPHAALLAPSPRVGDSSISSQQHPPQPPEPPPVVGGSKFEEIDCLINDEASIKCRRAGGEIYMPFGWMEKYFEVYGKVAQYDGYDRFEFQHSYSKVYTQREPYHPDGVFMSFEGYNVEVRDRVKCISGVEGKLFSNLTTLLGWYSPHISAVDRTDTPTNSEDHTAKFFPSSHFLRDVSSISYRV